MISCSEAVKQPLAAVCRKAASAGCSHVNGFV
jgi:hypothetical protein